VSASAPAAGAVPTRPAAVKNKNYFSPIFHYHLLAVPCVPLLALLSPDLVPLLLVPRLFVPQLLQKIRKLKVFTPFPYHFQFRAVCILGHRAFQLHPPALKI